MNIAFLATGSFALPSLRAVVAAGHMIHPVISQPDRPAGRGRTTAPTPVHALADELGLCHLQAEDVNALPMEETFRGCELAVVMDFGQKIGSAILRYLPRGCINIHGSLLPAYRGAAPFQRAIIQGETVTGVTCFQLDEKWDAGGILGQRTTPIGVTETADELHDRLATLGAELLVTTIADLAAGRTQPQPQNVASATRAPKLTRAESLIDFSQPADQLVRWIHGLWSWPGATCEFISQSGKRERLQLVRATVVDDRMDSTAETPPGTFQLELSVQCAPGCIKLLEVQPAGGKRMPFVAYANGRRIAAGDRLVRLAGP